MTKCRECKEGDLKIVGTGYLGDTVEVECPSCGECYEVEPDGLDMAGEEWVIAKMKDMEK
jgi:hypothetical protein